MFRRPAAPWQGPAPGSIYRSVRRRATVQPRGPADRLVVRLMVLMAGWPVALAACGAEEVASVEVGTEEVTAPLELDVQVDVQPWARIEVATRDVPRDRPIDRFPRISEFMVIVEGPDGAVFQRRCDPFETRVFRRLRVEEDRRIYEGRLDACHFVAGPGQFQLRVRRLDAIEHERYEIVHSELVLRARPSP